MQWTLLWLKATRNYSQKIRIWFKSQTRQNLLNLQKKVWGGKFRFSAPSNNQPSIFHSFKVNIVFNTKMMMVVKSVPTRNNHDEEEQGECHLNKVAHIHSVMRKIASYLSLSQWSRLMLAYGGRIFQLFCCKTVQFRIPKDSKCLIDPDLCPTPFRQNRYYDWEREEFICDTTINQDCIDPASKYVTGFLHQPDIHNELCRCTNRFQKVQKAEVEWSNGDGFKQTIQVTVPNRTTVSRP